jgi:hypothetical protein
MSQENIEVVRAFFEAWNAGNMDALRELHDPDLMGRPPEGWPEPGPFVGREAVMRQFEQLRETWDADALELISDFIDALATELPCVTSGVARVTAPRRTLRSHSSSRCARAESCSLSTSGITPMPSKP